MLNGHMRTFASIFSATLILMVLHPSAARAMGDCKHPATFSDDVFNHPEIKKLVKRYMKSTSPDPALAAELAAFGKDVVPFMDRLACVKTHGIYFMNPKAGFFGVYSDTPYVFHATVVLEALQDRNAIPFLKQMMLDREGGAAQDALIHLNADFSKDEVLRIIDSDSKDHAAQSRLKIYRQMIKRMPPDEAATVIAHLFDGGLPYVHSNGIADFNWVVLAPEMIPQWIETIDLLASTHSQIAHDLLSKQYKNLTAAQETGQMRHADAFMPVLAEYHKVLQ